MIDETRILIHELTNVFDDDGTDLRIVGSIDDGSARAFMLPLTKTEIMKPTGELT